MDFLVVAMKWIWNSQIAINKMIYIGTKLEKTLTLCVSWNFYSLTIYLIFGLTSIFFLNFPLTKIIVSVRHFSLKISLNLISFISVIIGMGLTC